MQTTRSHPHFPTSLHPRFAELAEGLSTLFEEVSAGMPFHFTPHISNSSDVGLVYKRTASPMEPGYTVMREMQSGGNSQQNHYSTQTDIMMDSMPPGHATHVNVDDVGAAQDGYVTFDGMVNAQQQSAYSTIVSPPTAAHHNR